MNGIVDLSMCMQCVTADCDLKLHIVNLQLPPFEYYITKIHSFLAHILGACVSCVHNVVCIM